VIISPVTQEVTHLLVKQKKRPHTKRRIPIGWVTGTTPELIRLRCTKDELSAAEPFLQTERIRVERLLRVSPAFLFWFAAIPETSVERERVPPGELALHRGTRVEAVDGRAGYVDEFFVDPATGRITKVVLREGRSWNRRKVSVDVSEVDHYGEDAVYLRLDRHTLESLPAI
jgi:hypothetical protein